MRIKVDDTWARSTSLRSRFLAEETPFLLSLGHAHDSSSYCINETEYEKYTNHYAL
jgi:hypothetical protein